MEAFARDYVERLSASLAGIDPSGLQLVAQHLERCIRERRAIFLLGNGGSSATPSHSAADWTKELGARCLSLSDNPHLLTAISNDIAYEAVFELQLKVHLVAGDLVIGYSGSGNSPNVLRAVEFASAAGAVTVGMTGNYKGMGGGKLAKLVQIPIVVPETSMERIEDSHLVINHILKEYLKLRLPGPSSAS